jgi:hypothetical protein
MSNSGAPQAAKALAPLLHEATELHASVARLRGMLHLQMRQMDAIERIHTPAKPEGRVAANRLVLLRRSGQL